MKLHWKAFKHGLHPLGFLAVFKFHVSLSVQVLLPFGRSRASENTGESGGSATVGSAGSLTFRKTN